MRPDPTRRRRTVPLVVVAACALVAAGSQALDLQPPRFTRAQMEASLSERERFRFVYGTRDPATAPLLRQRALLLARRVFGGDSSQVAADREVGEAEIARSSVVLLGSPRENEWTLRFAPALPVQFTDHAFRWQGKLYDRPDDALTLVYPHPLAPRRFVLVVAANSPAGLSGRGGFMFGGEDWRIVRAGELARSGTFAQDAAHPWRYDPALDRDREADRARYAGALRPIAGGALVVRAPAGLALAAVAHAGGAALLERLAARGLGAPARAAPVTLTLYRSLEEKGVLARDTRPEHLDGAVAHAALPAGREALDLWSVAAARLVSLGASADSRFLEPAGAWLAGRLEGEPLEQAVSRLYFGRAWPTAAEAATRADEWRSPLVWTPARAILARAVWESAPSASRRAALLTLLKRDPPGTLDSLCRAAAVPASGVAARYRQIADSLARSGQRSLALHRPRPWRPADGFQRGVCLAHAVSLEHGYLSADCGRQLRTLHDAGADWISLTPFGYLPDLHTPRIFTSAQGGVDEESDEAICEAAARARALGMRVWLKPHLWSRGWTGQLDFTASDWPRFFDRYREFILHWALLAERERMDGLAIGHELGSSTATHADRWRSTIGDVRALYTGTLTYDANWDEVPQVAFWDALDVIGVSFYFPLAAQPTRDPATLRAGAAKALAGLRPLAQKWGRPVLLAELGYPPRPAAAVRPWEEGSGAADDETQRACYRAAIDAMEPCDWLAGAFWWKWPSGEGAGGPSGASYSPRGRPAEAEMRQALQAWQRRPVRILGPAR